MTEVCKLVFDVSLWFTLSGYFLLLTAGDAPSVWGFLALSAAVCLDALIRARLRKDRQRGVFRFLPLFLPLLALLSPLTLWQGLQLLPAWLYLGWSFLTDRVGATYDGFRAHFSFALKLLPLLVFGPLFPGKAAAAIMGTIPYLILMLALGICLLRSLREGRASSLRQGLYIAGFILACALLTLGRAPQMLLRAVGCLWQYVLAPLIFLLALVFAAVLYGAYLLMRWLVERAQGSSEPFQPDLQGVAEAMGLEDKFDTYTTDLRWLYILLIVLGVCLLGFLLFLFFRRMLGEKARSAQPDSWRTLHGSAPLSTKRAQSHTILRPSDPRMAVRYDYARFLTECGRRGFVPAKGMTASELCRRSALLFPDADPNDLHALYVPARYSELAPVSREDARRSAEAFRRLKRSAAPGEKRKKNAGK